MIDGVLHRQACTGSANSMISQGAALWYPAFHTWGFAKFDLLLPRNLSLPEGKFDPVRARAWTACRVKAGLGQKPDRGRIVGSAFSED